MKDKCKIKGCYMWEPISEDCIKSECPYIEKEKENFIFSSFSSSSHSFIVTIIEDGIVRHRYLIEACDKKEASIIAMRYYPSKLNIKNTEYSTTEFQWDSSTLPVYEMF